jgi:hypothetical protein
MKTRDILQKKHELWLSILFGAFSIQNEKLFDEIYDFAMIEYRHLSWIGSNLAEIGEEFDFDKDNIDFQADNNFELFEKLIKQIEQMNSFYPQNNDKMYQRFISDEIYFIQKLREYLSDESNNEEIKAFNKSRVLEGYELNQKQSDSLILFLFEEAYKEYELILVYTYSNLFTDSKLLSSVFVDLIYESHFHLKSFARMMSKMGLLAVPRTIVQRVYQFDDLEQFLIDGIKEEEMAKEGCLALAKAVDHPSLSNFFNFINFQENYHIALMEKALAHIRSKK